MKFYLRLTIDILDIPKAEVEEGRRGSFKACESLRNIIWRPAKEQKPLFRFLIANSSHFIVAGFENTPGPR